MPIPRFLLFLKEIFGNDVDIISYVKRWSGYALTGLTIEHALAFFHGGGGNGKGALLATLTGAMGEYAHTAPIETFTESNQDRHPTELAMLRGQRLVVAQETEQGRRWAESRIKALTGGDKITARFMRQDFFEFVPQFKLIIAGNHKPGLRSVDEAMRRRFNLVPFNITIPDETKDKQLVDKLRSEWPGILAWMIEGCIEWQEQGLNPPESVRIATADYLETEDQFGTWLDECCERADHSFEKSKDLFASWRQWAEAAGEFVGSQKRFAESMRSHSFEPARQLGTRQRGFDGVRLR